MVKSMETRRAWDSLGESKPIPYACEIQQALVGRFADA
jgi:hypothetical protein